MGVPVSGYQVFAWEGQPIANIEQWAADRGEKMVDVTWHVKELSMLTGDFVEYDEDQTMPVSFWNSMRFPPDRTVVRSTERDPRP